MVVRDRGERLRIDIVLVLLHDLSNFVVDDLFAAQATLNVIDSSFVLA